MFFHEWKNLQHNFSCQILSWKDNVLKLGFWIKKLCCGFFHSFHSWKNTTKQQWSMRPKVFWISDQTLWLRVSVLCTVGLLKPISLFHFTFFLSLFLSGLCRDVTTLSMPFFTSKPNTYRAQVGNSVILICQVENLGKLKCCFWVEFEIISNFASLQIVFKLLFFYEFQYLQKILWPIFVDL